MGYLKFKDTNEILEAKVIKISENVIRLKFQDKIVENTNGFQYAKDPKMKMVLGNFEKYNTIWKREEDGYMLSADGSVYVEKEITKIPEQSQEQSIESLKESKVNEMHALQQKTIKEGVAVELADGTIEQFSLSEYDQTSLIALSTKVKEGVEKIPWHNTNENEHCKFYSNEDMEKITTAAINFITYHVTYFRDLRIYIRSLLESEDIEKVTYGMLIPEAYQSEPLKQMLAAQM